MTPRLAPALPGPDFLRPARHASGLAWLACGSALLVLGVAGADAWSAWQALQTAEADLQRSQRQQTEAARAQPGSPTAHRAARAGLTASAAAASEARRWLQGLARPWPAIWAASEGASLSGIDWQSMDLREDGQLRLLGQATDTRTALRAADPLRQQVLGGRGVWREVVVTRIDHQAGGQRFELQARLNSADDAAAARPPGAPGSPPGRDPATADPAPVRAAGP